MQIIYHKHDILTDPRPIYIRKFFKKKASKKKNYQFNLQ